jgi:hypothetical protein
MARVDPENQAGEGHGCAAALSAGKSWDDQIMTREPPIKPTSRARKRHGRCYELAYRAMLDNASWTLVHGRVNGPPDGRTPMGHAWLERDGWVYDVVQDQLLTVERYRSAYDAEPLASWSQVHAAQLMLAANHYGPWVRELDISGNEEGRRR